MEQFIKVTRYPNLIKFCNQQPETVKDYIKHFDTEADAKKNIQHKMKVAFQNIKGKEKRGPGLEVNLGSLFEVAKSADIFSHNLQPEDEADDFILDNGFNVSLHFRQFNVESIKKSKESGFYIDGNLHQIFPGHSFILNIEEGTWTDVFGKDELKELAEDLRIRNRAQSM